MSICKESELDTSLQRPQEDLPRRVYPLPIYLGWLKEDLPKKNITKYPMQPDSH